MALANAIQFLPGRYPSGELERRFLDPALPIDTRISAVRLPCVANLAEVQLHPSPPPSPPPPTL